MNEGVAAALVKGGSKLIPALMTGIGAAGTIMQSKKNIDPMDFGKSKRSEEEKEQAKDLKKRLGGGKRHMPSDVKSDKLNRLGNPTAKTKGKETEPKKKSSKGFGEEYCDWRQELEEKCWPGYEKKGMKTMFGKSYPNCVKKSNKKK